MKVILTGGSGFLGTNIIEKSINHDITTIGRTNCDIIADLSRDIPKLPAADLIIHAAGKAHSIPKSLNETNEFFLVNVQGTKNLLNGISVENIPKYFIYISSVSVYGLLTGINIDEQNQLLAKDPYGASKIEAEEIVREWCKNKNVICTILRLPLIVGKNPPGNLGAMIKGIQKGYYFNIGNANARKSMVNVNDVISILYSSCLIGGTYNLTDGYHPNFKELSHKIAADLISRRPLTIPGTLAKVLAIIGDCIGKSFPINSLKLTKINSSLTFDDTKAQRVLDWKPKRVLDSTII